MLELLFIVSCLMSLPLYAGEWHGECIGISDGDTIRVMLKKKEIKIRLYGIDCPEKGQDYGTVARQFTGDLIFRKRITVNPIGKDRYGRTIAYIEVDGLSVNRELITQGLAWVYTKYCEMDECNDWKTLEEAARNDKRGLWSQPNPIPPWEWRRRKRH